MTVRNTTVRDLSRAFAAEWAQALADPKATRYALLASDPERLGQRLGEIEARTRRRLINMQSRWWIDPYDKSAVLDRRSADRGITLRLFVPKRAIELSPILPSVHPDLWIAPVLQDAMLVDDSLAVLSGGMGEDGQLLFCSTTDATLIGMLCDIAAELEAQAVRAEAITGKAPLSARQADVAMAMTRGDKDTTTARRLRVSVRTVEREVSAVLAHLGCRTRQEAALAVMGERS